MKLKKCDYGKADQIYPSEKKEKKSLPVMFLFCEQSHDRTLSQLLWKMPHQ